MGAYVCWKRKVKLLAKLFEANFFRALVILNFLTKILNAPFSRAFIRTNQRLVFWLEPNPTKTNYHKNTHWVLSNSPNSINSHHPSTSAPRPTTCRAWTFMPRLSPSLRTQKCIPCAVRSGGFSKSSALPQLLPPVQRPLSRHPNQLSPPPRRTRLPIPSRLLSIRCKLWSLPASMTRTICTLDTPFWLPAVSRWLSSS